MRHSARLLGIKLTLALLLSICFSSIGLAEALPAAADTSAPKEGVVHGTQLTADQIAALKQAWTERKSLSIKQAQAVIDSVAAAPSGLVTPVEAGWAAVQGDCSYDHLEGYSYGSYYWYQQDNRIGPISFGEAQFSTNGFTASISDYWYGAGPYQSNSGNILWNGWGASGTTWSGWGVFANGWYCSGTLFARW